MSENLTSAGLDAVAATLATVSLITLRFFAGCWDWVGRCIRRGRGIAPLNGCAIPTWHDCIGRLQSGAVQLVHHRGRFRSLSAWNLIRDMEEDRELMLARILSRLTTPGPGAY